MSTEEDDGVGHGWAKGREGERRMGGQEVDEKGEKPRRARAGD
jgi:hypothetical protein